MFIDTILTQGQIPSELSKEEFIKILTELGDYILMDDSVATRTEKDNFLTFIRTFGVQYPQLTEMYFVMYKHNKEEKRRQEMWQKLKDEMKYIESTADKPRYLYPEGDFRSNPAVPSRHKRWNHPGYR